MKELFVEFGEVVEVRFPSLQFNTHRRFCYVQFPNAQQAQAATKLDGVRVNDKYDLIAKISNPSIKQDRHGAIYDGREVYVGNLNWRANEQEVKELFSTHGTIERVRIPRDMAGKSKAAAFVIFKDKVFNYFSHTCIKPNHKI